jgi:nucleoside deoxyribosyltransferase
LSKKSYYFGAGWFSDKQNKAYKEALSNIKSNPTFGYGYVPLEHQYKNIRVDLHPEYLHDKEWAIATYNGDLTGIKTTNISLFVYIPSEEDIGCGVEMGIAKSLGKYVLLVIPDKYYGEPINLMSFGIADNVIKMSELSSFDANEPSFNFYEGAVY